MVDLRSLLSQVPIVPVEVRTVGTLHLRRMKYGEWIKYNIDRADLIKTENLASLAQLHADTLLKVLVDESGNRLFQDNEQSLIDNLHPSAVSDLLRAIADIHAAPEINDAKKNSNQTSTDGSAPGSN